MFGSIITIKSIAYQHIPFQQRYIGISFSSASKVVFSHLTSNVVFNRIPNLVSLFALLGVTVVVRLTVC